MLINSIKNEQARCLGYVWDVGFTKHWFQFADDTAIIYALQETSYHVTFLRNGQHERTYVLV